MSASSATPEGTARYFARVAPALPPRALGRTGLQVSPVGFGCYRVGDDPSQEAAMALALRSGCNLIDTSANYMDGESERAVGRALRGLFAEGSLARDEVIVVTKAGYVQGSNMAIAREREASGRSFPEMVRYSDDCWHCLHPEFLEDQLTRSLERLGLERVDALLLHNPEYFLKTESDHREYYRRIGEAFAYLEREVARGRIRCYGVSSNTFPEPKEAADFTSLETLLELAESIRPDHSFAVIQFPLNLFEPGAALENNNSSKTVLELASLRGLGTLANRPLNAFTGERMLRLASFHSRIPSGIDPGAVVEEKLSDAARIEARFPGGASQGPTWAHVIHRNLPRLTDLDSWKNIVRFQIRPALEAAEAELGGSDAAGDMRSWWQEYRPRIDSVLSSLAQALEARAARVSREISGALDRAVPALKTSPALSRKALRIYRSLPGLDCVLLGMRREEYVRDALGLDGPAPFDPPLSAEEAFDALEGAALMGLPPTEAR